MCSVAIDKTSKQSSYVCMCSVAIDKTSKQSSNYLVFIYIYI